MLGTCLPAVYSLQESLLSGELQNIDLSSGFACISPSSRMPVSRCPIPGRSVHLSLGRHIYSSLWESWSNSPRLGSEPLERPELRHSLPLRTGHSQPALLFVCLRATLNHRTPSTAAACFLEAEGAVNKWTPHCSERLTPERQERVYRCYMRMSGWKHVGGVQNDRKGHCDARRTHSSDGLTCLLLHSQPEAGGPYQSLRVPGIRSLRSWAVAGEV